MTVKQFAYLATGVVLAGIAYKLPINVFVKFPFCIFSSLLGTGLAYFPVSGRPMDLMIGNYIKALFRPTQFIYEKTGGQIYFPNKTQLATMRKIKLNKSDFSLLPKDKLKIYLETLDTKQKNKVDEKEDNFLMSVSSLSTSNASQTNPQPNLAQQTYAAPQPITAPQPIPSAAKPSAKPEPQLPTPLGQIKTSTPILRKGFNRNIGMPNIPSSPNLITGITKDARGNDLSNILVEVKDKDDNPVRAFKTNEFGRFASATPLTNGTYTIEFEDPKSQNRFGKITINATGQIILPIEAISIDMREELRKSLFPTSTSVPREAPVPGGVQTN